MNLVEDSYQNVFYSMDRFSIPLYRFINQDLKDGIEIENHHQPPNEKDFESPKKSKNF
ncbi:MAG: hypothetical protein OXE77_10785 [Flavobacteriaceae bacterium]|nr:hypothetical protein [Flavobacteriaceae bacterium]